MLNRSTARSLVILDDWAWHIDLDGVAIAWAMAEFIQERLAVARCLPHYHELTDLVRSVPRTQLQRGRQGMGR